MIQKRNNILFAITVIILCVLIVIIIFYDRNSTEKVANKFNSANTTTEVEKEKPQEKEDKDKTDESEKVTEIPTIYCVGDSTTIGSENQNNSYVTYLSQSLNANIKVIGVEPAGANCLQASLKNGKVTTLPTVSPIADGTAVKTQATKVFPNLQKNLDDIITVPDEDLIVSFLDMVENHKMVVENSGLLTVAALKHLDVKGRKIVSILSGGNMDVLTMATVVQNGLILRDRIFTVAVMLPDKPGQLADVSALIAKLQGNVIKLDHNVFANVNRSAGVLLTITMETFGTEHKKQILQALEDAGYAPSAERTSRIYM